MVSIRDKNSPALQAVIVVTKHGGVIFGYANPDDFDKRSFPMMKTRVALSWGTRGGINQLAAEGPTIDSDISAQCDAPRVHDIIKVLAVTEEAEERWKNV